MLTDRLTRKDTSNTSENSTRLYDITFDSSFTGNLTEEESNNNDSEEVCYNTIKTPEQFYIIPQDNPFPCPEYRFIACICCICFFIVCGGIILIKNLMRQAGQNLMSQLI